MATSPTGFFAFFNRFSRHQKNPKEPAHGTRLDTTQSPESGFLESVGH